MDREKQPGNGESGVARDQPVARAEFRCGFSAKEDLGPANLWHIALGRASPPVEMSTGKPRQSAGGFWEGVQLWPSWTPSGWLSSLRCAVRFPSEGHFS